MIRLRFCTIAPDSSGCTVLFQDGAMCEAKPHNTPHYHVIAHRCGYQDNITAYCIEHEFAHCFLEDRLHGRASPALWAVAHGKPLNGPQSMYEEAVAQTFQRWLRANERPIIGGVDWDGLKRDALELLK